MQEAAVSSPSLLGDLEIALPWDFAGKIACIT
jgi:hypothetical protein